jgi:peptidoglycan hydrolase-like protein with peptidoglycan-binding domain
MKKIQLLGSIAFGLIALIPSTAFAATFTHNLSYGVTTTDVSQLQQFLADEGLYSGTITATFGSLTRSAVIAFQKQEGIVPANGYFGSVTRADANRVIAAHPEWTTTLSTNGHYSNVNGNSVSKPAYSSNGVPAGATAECRDGTYSFSLNHRGSCSHHGGVASWLQ